MSEPMLLAALSPEIHLKSRPVRARFARMTRDHVAAVLESGAQVEEVGRGRLRIVGGDDRAEEVARVFGVARVEEVEEIEFPDLEQGVARLAAAARPMVEGRTFAVRCKRSGSHPWRSPDLERALGAVLLPSSAGVDLTDPEVTVKVRVVDDRAYLVTREWSGAGGLPLGSQGKALVLLSGGYDSAVAAWRLMRRGVAVEFVHFSLACAQRDQALALAHRLWTRWGRIMDGRVHVVDFGPAREALIGGVAPRYRQVVLKERMLKAAGWMARELDFPAVATGESIGQVSSQTFTHLAGLDALSEVPVLRPLLAFDKEEIVAEARRIGVAELAERAGEACDLSEGHRVETSVPADAIARIAVRLGDDSLQAALASWRIHHLSEWVPGSEGRARAA